MITGMFNAIYYSVMICVLVRTTVLALRDYKVVWQKYN